MSDENKPKPVRKTSSVPLRKTSAVPLRKETVRVTLKATPQDSKPPHAPLSTVPAPVPAPAPTIPLKTLGTASPQPPAPAPTIPLKTGAPTKAPTPLPTVKLGTPTTPAPATLGASSQPLPKATVQLQDTKSMGSPTMASPTQGPTIVTAQSSDTSVSKEDGPASALSIIALVAALIVLGVQLSTANIWVNDETQTNPGWGKLFE